MLKTLSRLQHRMCLPNAYMPIRPPLQLVERSLTNSITRRLPPDIRALVGYASIATRARRVCDRLRGRGKHKLFAPNKKGGRPEEPPPESSLQSLIAIPAIATQTIIIERIGNLQSSICNLQATRFPPS
jgi:hypothetical protein